MVLRNIQSQDLILAVDIGNTNTQLGVFTGDRNLITHQRVSNQRLKDFFKRWRSGPGLNIPRIVSAVKYVLMVSTNPRIESILKKWVKNVFKIKTLKPDKDFPIPIPILVDEPAKVGRDRLLNALAGYERKHQATVVIDFGTAITFNVVSTQGEFLGGVIAPGINMMARALHQDCILLPLIKPKPIEQTIGKNTQQAIQSGIYLGTIGLVNLTLDKIISELKSTPHIIATGGDAELIVPALPLIKETTPTLTLEGLVLAFTKRKS